MKRDHTPQPASVWGVDDSVLVSVNQAPNSPEGQIGAWKRLLPTSLSSGAEPSSITEAPEAATIRLEIGNRYYESVLDQSKQSFKWALIAAVAGFFFFLAAIVFLLTQQPDKLSYVSLISGAFIEVISAVNFYLYGRTSSQLLTFHERLEGEQRYLDIFKLADIVCGKIEGKQNHDSRALLVQKIADFALVISKEQKSGKQTKDEKPKIDNTKNKRGKKQAPNLTPN